jgi:diacylglycerol kinase (ATP)
LPTPPRSLTSSTALAVIINPISGGGGAGDGRIRAERAAAALVTHGIDGEIFVTERRGHGYDLAQRAVARGAERIVAWGGDGTVNEVASALVRTDTALAIVPSGSGNGLARALGVSRDPARAISEAFRAEPRVIDAGQCEGRWFFSVAGMGFDAHVAACFDLAKAGRRGLSTYARITLRELLTYRPASYRIDGEPPGPPSLLITVANSSQFGNGAIIAPRARLDDGLLDVVVFAETSRLKTMLSMPRLFTGGVERVRGVFSRQVERVTIEGAHPMIYHLDGEPRQGGERLDFTIVPAVLRVSVR